MNEHGTVSRYKNDGCRCGDCHAALRQYAKEYRRRRRGDELVVDTSDLPRFSKKYRVDDGGCWAWAGYLNEYGYGRFAVNTRTLYAHRWSYEFYIGPIPEGTEIDHLCRNRRCVNPDHLEAVSHRENVIRSRPQFEQTVGFSQPPSDGSIAAPVGAPYRVAPTGAVLLALTSTARSR